MLKELKTSILMLAAFTLLTGVMYPLAMTGIAQLVFPRQANASLIERDGRTLGSELIGQPMEDPKYFWSRPSGTGPYGYNAASSSGSNLAVSNPTQIDAIQSRVARLRESGVPAETPIPIDLVTASGSGLDPHISLAAAEIQIARVSLARAMSEDVVRGLVKKHSHDRQFGILGEPTVNVLLLNLDLDSMGKK
jgi:K+-transporting ATPase ATPase C chain